MNLETAPQSYTEAMLEYEISPSEAAELLKRNAAKIVGVREPWEFSTAHIEGSQLMPMREVPIRARQELDSAERIVIVCHLGVRSMHVTAWLRDQGFENVQSLRGGIDAWSVQVDPSLPRY